MADNEWWPHFCYNRSDYDAFWSPSITTNTWSPDFTNCFQWTVLTYVSCGVLWLLCPFYALYLSRQRTENTWTTKSWQNLIKMMLSTVASVVSAAELVVCIKDGQPPAFILTCVLRIATYVLCAVVIHWEHKKCVSSSGVLFMYLLLEVLYGVVNVRSLSMQHDVNPLAAGLSYTRFGLIVLLWILVLCVDKSAFTFEVKQKRLSRDGMSEKTPLLNGGGKIRHQLLKKAKAPPTPEGTASFLSDNTYAWITRFMYKGYSSELQFDELYDLMERDKCRKIVPRFQQAWDEQVRKYKGCMESSSSDFPSKSSAHYISLGIAEKSPPEPSIVWAICKSLGVTYWLASAIRIVSIGMQFANPLLLRELLQWLESDDPYVWKGVGLAVCMFLCSILWNILVQKYCYYAFLFGVQMRSAVTAAVYRKSLRLSSAAKRQTTVGQIVNLMAVDAQRLQDIPLYLTTVWSAPILVFICICLLWDTMGVASLAGMAFLVLIITPFNGVVVADRIKKLQVFQMIHKDERVKMMSEILSGIKVLKLYGWEPSFLKKVLNVRNTEIKYMKEASLMTAVSAIFWNCSSFLVVLVIYAVYIFMSPDNVLNPENAFVTASLVNVLTFPLSWLPAGVAYCGQTIVSLQRLQAFLMLDEIDEDTVTREPKADNAIEIRNGQFSWGKDEVTTLTNIHLKVKPGAFVAVVGQVGSGKSSLISAILGEMWRLNGTVSVKSSTAYVPQQAWIQNNTVKGNILFSYPYDDQRYQQIVKACALEPDFKILVDGDMTEIGEKGINLSGGQKQRISLARAVYQDCDIYLLDDPLSAVDTHVGKELFEQVIGPNGMLRNKTRVLVTHSITFLPKADYIIVMRDGRISETGTYNQLLSTNGAFAEFLRAFATEAGYKDNETESAIVKEAIMMLDTNSVSSEPGISPFSSSVRTRRLIKGPSSVSSASSHQSSVYTQSILSNEPRTTMKLVQEEAAEMGNIKASIIKTFIMSAGLKAVIICILFHMLNGCCMIMANIWLAEWTNDPMENNGTTTMEEKKYRLSVYVGIMVAQVVTILVASLGLAYGCVNASVNLHSKLAERLLKAPMSFFDTTPLGRIMNRVSKDLDAIDFNIPLQIRQWFFQIIPLFTTFVIVSYGTPVFLVAIVPLGAFYFFMQRVYARTIRQLRRIDSVRRSPVFIHFDETITGASSIRAYGQQDRFVQKCDQLIDDSQRAWYLYTLSMRWIGLLLESIGSVIILLASLMAILQKDTMNSGVAGMTISFSLQAAIYFDFYVRASSELETFMVAVERVNEYSNVKTEAPWYIERTSPPRTWPDEGNVSYQKYSTRYRPGLDLVLNEISCSIKSREKIGVVGRTGAGKSSLALSLFRLIEPVGGSIVIDGLDICQMGLLDLRSQLTIIPQDPVIFSGSLRMNMDPFERYTDDEIWASLELAHLKDFVSSITQGLDYQVGENGEALSIGQRQLVCLARALLRKSRVLVLDEATAAVDLETDELIQQTIRTAFQDCTIITIAHRINTIMDYDRVMVMGGGHILEFDSPGSLLKNKESVFYGMAKDGGLV